MKNLFTYLMLGSLLAPGLPVAAQNHAEVLLRELYSPTGRVLVVAHRGDWRNAPENSLRAVVNCIRMGVDIVEIDVRTTKDNELVLMHDKTLDRTTTGTGKVSDYTLEQIRTLRLTNGYGVPTLHQVPTLQEVLQATRGKVLVYIDKSECCLRDAYSIAEQTGTAREVLFYGSRPREQLMEALGSPADHIIYLPKIGDETPSPAEYVRSFEGYAPAFVTSFSQEDSPGIKLWPQIKSSARIWASPLWPELCAGRTDDLAVDDPEAAWGWLIDRGASVLCTDRPAALIDYLKRRESIAER